MSDRVENIANSIRICLETRKRHIGEIRQLADNHDRLTRAFNGRKKAPLVTKIAGGAALVLGGVVAVVSTIGTAGAAAPLWVGGLSIGGSALGVGGGIWGLSLEMEKSKSEEILKGRIRELLAEDAEMQRRATRALEDIQMLEFSETTRVVEQVRGIINLCLGLNIAFGSTVTLFIMLPLALTPIPLFCGTIAKICTALGPVIATGAQEISKMVGKEVADDIARETVKEMQPGITKMFVEHQAKMAAKHALQTDAVTEASKKLLHEAAKKAAQEAASEATKTMARITGSMTIVLGAVFALWDTVNLVKAHEKSKEEAKSKMGEALRMLADEVERELRRNRG